MCFLQSNGFYCILYNTSGYIDNSQSLLTTFELLISQKLGQTDSNVSHILLTQPLSLTQLNLRLHSESGYSQRQKDMKRAGMEKKTQRTTASLNCAADLRPQGNIADSEANALQKAVVKMPYGLNSHRKLC